MWGAGASFGLVGENLEGAFVAAGVVVALAHLFLGSFTERGVCLMTRRLAPAHFRSENLLVNGLFIAAGVVLFLS